MANKLLEMRHWAVSSTDDKEALLKHKDGHEMRVALKALPRLQQEQIKRIKMSDGGQAKKKDSTEYGVSPKNTLDPESTEQFKQAFSPEPSPSPSPQPQAQNYADQGLVQSSDSSDSASDSTTNHGDVHIIINSGAPQPIDQAKQVLASPSNQPAPAPAAPPAQPQTPPQVTSQDARQAQVAATQQGVGKLGAIADQNQDNFNELKQHADDFANYIQQNPINPRSYQESQSADQKTNTAIGLFLGGVGGGGHGNVALDFLNKQIDRDVSAQEKNAENRNTVWGAYEHLYNDSKIASDLSRASALDILDQKMKLAALKIGTPQAQANANQFTQMAAQDRNSALQSAAQNLGKRKTFMEQKADEDQKLQDLQNSPVQPLLQPGASGNFQGLQFNPNAEKDYPAATSQFTQASQADKALANLGPTFNKLIQLRTMSGRGRHEAESAFGNLPYGVGDVISGPARALTGTDTNLRYDSAQSQLLSDLNAAFKGSNVSSGEIKDVIEKNSPVYGDSAQTLRQKRDTIEGFIKRSVPTSLLQKYGLTKE